MRLARVTPFLPPCATSHHPPRPIPPVAHLPILLGPLRGPSHTPFSVQSPFPIIPCLYPTGPPAALWRGPTGSSSIRGPFHVPSTGCSLPAPFPLGGVFPSCLVGGPSFWRPPPPVPVLFPHLVTCCCCFSFPHAPPAVPRLPVCSFPFPRCLLALRFEPSGGPLGFHFCFFLVCPPPFPLCVLPFGTLLPACTHVSTALVIWSWLPSVLFSCLLALLGRCPWRSLAMPGGRPLAPLSSLPSLPSPPFCLLPALLLLLSCFVCSPLFVPAPGLY